MITNYGWTGFVKGMANAQPLPFISNGTTSPSGQNPISIGTVESISNIETGEIAVLSQGNTTSTVKAIPFFSNIKHIPIEGEVVILIKNELQTDVTNNSTYYLGSFNVWNNPSLNSVQSNNQISNPSTKDYFSPLKVKNVTPLFSLPGDTIFEGRFGNTIRLGNTNPNYPNDWSSSGEKGDPITIINNGQLESNSSIENINENLSSIYLTSYQKIANFSLAKQSFSSYNRGQEPVSPKEFTSPQIILNSDRVTLNAKTDSVLISGEKSVFLSSNKSVNITSKEFYMDSIDIRLGSPNASEPVLLGDETVKQLIKLTNQVKNLGKIAETLKIYPGGNPVPDAGSNLIGNNITSTCDSILNKLKDNKRGIKSNFVKTR
tara:strand:- start:53 stop:1180 length:1128 start_codon:yes stop_codon:yes gene_type:complete